MHLHPLARRRLLVVWPNTFADVSLNARSSLPNWVTSRSNARNLSLPLRLALQTRTISLLLLVWTGNFCRLQTMIWHRIEMLIGKSFSLFWIGFLSLKLFSRLPVFRLSILPTNCMTGTARECCRSPSQPRFKDSTLNMLTRSEVFRVGTPLFVTSLLSY